MMEKKEPPTFDEVTVQILENVGEDRKRLLDVIDSMKEIAANHTEAALVMCEQIIRAHDVLNKMTAQLAGLSSMLLKEKTKAPPEDPMEEIWDDLTESPFEDRDPKEN